MADHPAPLKTMSQFQILNTIRIAETISRTEIADIIGHSRATITNITARMIQSGLIYEKATEDSAARGRNRIMLAINPDAAYVVGVKLSAFGIGCVVTDILANEKSSIVMPVRTAERPAEFIADLIEEAIRHCVKDAGLTLKQISGIGVGVPGLIDSSLGVSHWSPLYRRGQTPLKEMIHQRLNIPAWVDNDSNTVTLSQLWVGHGKGINNFVVITIEDGLGMGIVVDGELYRGSNGFAGELGHFVATPDGEQCRCGKNGCYEAYTSNFSIVRRARQLCQQGILACKDPEDLTYECILDQAREGNKHLTELFSNAGQYLGLALSGIIQMLNPAKIIITGNGTRAGSLYFDTMYETIAQNTAPGLFTATDVSIAPWQDIDWSLGAACLVLQELYKSPFDRCIATEKMQGALDKQAETVAEGQK